MIWRGLVQVLLLAAPWPLRRRLLHLIFGYEIAPSARIGASLILCEEVRIGEGARIGHLNLIKGLRRLALEDSAAIGGLNWISGFPLGHERHFAEDTGREPALLVGRHAAITSRHLIDCTDRVTLGAFSILGGWGSQILTHAIDLKAARQAAGPVEIGDYCFVGTRVVLLKTARLPHRSVLAAGAVLAGRLEKEGMVYGGVPAREIGPVEPEAAYFHRPVGHVW